MTTNKPAARRPYGQGLHGLGDGCHAWLEPPGTWGMANSGVVVGRDRTLVIDTQNDVPMALALRAAVDQLTPEGRPAEVVLNTHGDGDHWNGNFAFPEATIISSRETSEDIAGHWLRPQDFARAAEDDTDYGRFVKWRTRVYDYTGWSPRHPEQTFEGDTVIDLGGSTVRLTMVGPAHTRGDTIAHVVESGVLYAGDILFAASTPIVWAGPVSRMALACQRIIDAEPRVIVPGHGPLMSSADVAHARDYLTSVEEWARDCWQAGRTPHEAYRGFAMQQYTAWTHWSRTYLNIYAVYAELEPDVWRDTVPERLAVALRDDDGAWRSPIASGQPARPARKGG